METKSEKKALALIQILCSRYKNTSSVAFAVIKKILVMSPPPCAVIVACNSAETAAFYILFSLMSVVT